MIRALRALWYWLVGRSREPEVVETIKKTTPRICISIDCTHRGQCFLYLDVNQEFPAQYIQSCFGHQLLPYFKDGQCITYEREKQDVG